MTTPCARAPVRLPLPALLPGRCPKLRVGHRRLHRAESLGDVLSVQHRGVCGLLQCPREPHASVTFAVFTELSVASHARKTATNANAKSANRHGAKSFEDIPPSLAASFKKSKTARALLLCHAECLPRALHLATRPRTAVCPASRASAQAKHCGAAQTRRCSPPRPHLPPPPPMRDDGWQRIPHSLALSVLQVRSLRPVSVTPWVRTLLEGDAPASSHRVATACGRRARRCPARVRRDICLTRVGLSCGAAAPLR
ncbi:hypothetical protein ERJ75_000005000 [Trypanosoma vivax]|nr:hypothetical protein ERJ75_000005000 [Trypanosoma vivax]